MLTDDSSRCGVGRHDGGVTFESGAFIEQSVEIKEALRIAGGGVRERGYDFVSEHRGGRKGCGGDEAKEDEKGAQTGDTHLFKVP